MDNNQIATMYRNEYHETQACRNAIARALARRVVVSQETLLAFRAMKEAKRAYTDAIQEQAEEAAKMF